MVRNAPKPSALKTAFRALALAVALTVPVTACGSGSPAAVGSSISPSVSSTGLPQSPDTGVSHPATGLGTTAPTSNEPNTDPTAITGTTWLLFRAVVDGTTYLSPQPKGSSVFGSYTVQFVDGRLRANDACNSIDVSSVTVDAHSVTGSGNAGITDVACGGPPLREAYDRDLFGKTMNWTLVGDRLTLTFPGGDTFEYQPMTAGYLSDQAGEKHTTTPEKSIDGIRFRIYALPRNTSGDLCLTMEFAAPAGIPWEPVSACRDDLAAQYVVNPTDFNSRLLPSGTGIMFSAVPNGTATRIAYRPSGGGPAVEFTVTPLPGTTFQAFYGFVEHAEGGGTVTFYDAKGKPYHDVWSISW